MTRSLRVVVKPGCAAIAGCLVLAAIVCHTIVVRGTSMERAYHDGNRVLVLRADSFAYLRVLREHFFSAGRVVVSRSLEKPSIRGC